MLCYDSTQVHKYTTKSQIYIDRNKFWTRVLCVSYDKFEEKSKGITVPGPMVADNCTSILRHKKLRPVAVHRHLKWVLQVFRASIICSGILEFVFEHRSHP